MHQHRLQLSATHLQNIGPKVFHKNVEICVQLGENPTKLKTLKDETSIILQEVLQLLF